MNGYDCVNDFTFFFGKHYSLSRLDFMSVKVDFSVYKNIPSAFVTEDYTISHDLKDNNFLWESSMMQSSCCIVRMSVCSF